MNRTLPKGLFFAAEQAIAHMTDADMFEARRNAGAYVRIFAYDPYKMAAIAYTIGVVAGKKQERQRAKHRKELPEACVWNFIDTRRGRNMYNECRKCGDMTPYFKARALFHLHCDMAVGIDPPPRRPYGLDPVNTYAELIDRDLPRISDTISNINTSLRALEGALQSMAEREEAKLELLKTEN